MKRILIGIAAAGVLAAGFAIAQTTATPQAGAAKGKGVRALVRKRMLKALNLTDTQTQQAKTILQSARQTAQPQAPGAGPRAAAGGPGLTAPVQPPKPPMSAPAAPATKGFAAPVAVKRKKPFGP